MLVHAAGERFPASSVPGTPAAPVVYERRAEGWIQYWIWFASNPQDRGILRSGRHAGDWELVQYRSDGSEAVYAQHSGACDGGETALAGGFGAFLFLLAGVGVVRRRRRTSTGQGREGE